MSDGTLVKKRGLSLMGDVAMIATMKSFCQREYIKQESEENE